MGPVRILIVDDFEPWRRYVRSILAADADLSDLGESSDGLDAVRKSEEFGQIWFCWIFSLPKMNGLDAARQIGEVSPDRKIVFLSSSQSVEVMREALRIGAGFVMKADAERDLLPIVQAICRNEPFVRFRILDEHSPKSLMRYLAANFRLTGLACKAIRWRMIQKGNDYALRGCCLEVVTLVLATVCRGAECGVGG